MRNYHFQCLLFNSFLICGGISLFLANVVIKTFPTISFLIFIILIPITSLFVLLIPKFNCSIKTIINNKLLRTLSLLYTVLSGSFFIISYINVVSDYYFHETSKFIVLLLIIATCLFLSSYRLLNIFKIGFVISFIIIIFFLLIFTNTTKYDLLLLRYNSINFSNWYKFIYFIFIYLDSLLLLLFLPIRHFSKSKIISSIIITSVISSLMIFENYLFFVPSYFVNAKHPYLIKFFAYNNNRFFEHYDIFYLILITIYIVFSFSIKCEMSRILFKGKNNSFKNFLFPIFVIISFFITRDMDFNEILTENIILSFSIILISFFIIFSIIKRRSRCTQ